jgi:hypothetical protein
MASREEAIVPPAGLPTAEGCRGSLRSWEQSSDQEDTSLRDPFEVAGEARVVYRLMSTARCLGSWVDLPELDP